MKRELESKLVERYPTIFRDYGGPASKTCMAFGMECGSGWYKILDELCAKITELTEGSDVKVVALQVKEKFGALRFYYAVENPKEGSRINEAIAEMVGDAEELSYKTCESCGKPGKKRGQGWVKTLCDACCAK